MREDVTNIREATPGDATWIYPLPNHWYCGWTTDAAEEFVEIDEPVTIVRQRWLCERTETVVFHPRTELCPKCNGEGGENTNPTGWYWIDCSLCEGDGRHPLAGQMEVTP